MNFRKINNIAGWVIGGIATLVYLISMEATASFWDCGEFLSCAYKIEVGHSPGAPLFMLIQRMFGLEWMGNILVVKLSRRDRDAAMHITKPEISLLNVLVER